MTRLLLTLCLVLITTPAFAQEKKEDLDAIRMELAEAVRNGEMTREEAGEKLRAFQERSSKENRIDWEATYKEFLKDNPGVAKAVESGKISKDKVMAGIKARMAESKDEELKALYEKLLRENPDWRRTTFEQVRPRLEHMLREEAERGAEKKDAQDGQQDAATIQEKVDNFINENPEIAQNIRAQNFARENLEWMFRVEEEELGKGKLSQSEDAARARAELALKAAIKIMTESKKLKPEQAKELYEIVFPKGTDWDARYEAYLKENAGVASAVKSGRITKEKVIAGIKSLEGERPPTEEEQLEALYQKLLKEDRTLARTPKAQLMPRLKAMLARGEGKHLRPERSLRQRQMTFGLYFSGLIESGQVERFDKDLKRVHDVGSAEILRQGGQNDRRVERERSGDRERSERQRDR